MKRSPELHPSPGVVHRTAGASDAVLPFRDRPSTVATHAGRRERIGLFGLFGCGNSGNDGSLEAMLAFVRQTRPDAEIICFCAASRGASERITRSLHVAAIPLAVAPPERSLLRTLDRLSLGLPRRVASMVRAVMHARKLDALILPGTGILDDFGGSPFGMPLALLTWCLAARLAGVRIGFVSIGAGPIEHPISRWLMKSAAAMAHYRSYRDTVSKAFMESIGFDAHGDPVYPDIAFKLPAPSSPEHRRPDGRLVVGVGVMTYLGWRNDAADGALTYQTYLDQLTRFVLWLLDRGYVVRVLMGDTVDGRAVDDLLARVDVARPKLPADLLAFAPIASLHDLMRQLSETDVVVATRYHNVVCALKLGKPTVSIGYAQKNDALMAEIGLHGFCQHVDRLDFDLLIEQFRVLVGGRERYAQAIARANDAWQERLHQQDARLAAFLTRGTQGRRASTRGEWGR